MDRESGLALEDCNGSHIVHHDWEVVLAGQDAGECVFCVWPETAHHPADCLCDYHQTEETDNG